MLPEARRRSSLRATAGAILAVVLDPGTRRQKRCQEKGSRRAGPSFGP